ncbi:hypothetical protein AAC387_Pa04g1779 [Persea americana]
MARNIAETGRCERKSGRPIPRRGQVKAAIVIGLAHSFTSFFSVARRPEPARWGPGARWSFHTCLAAGRYRLFVCKMLVSGF